jgi:hypothetical protein
MVFRWYSSLPAWDRLNDRKRFPNFRNDNQRDCSPSLDAHSCLLDCSLDDAVVDAKNQEFRSCRSSQRELPERRIADELSQSNAGIVL